MYVLHKNRHILDEAQTLQLISLLSLFVAEIPIITAIFIVLQTLNCGAL